MLQRRLLADSASAKRPARGLFDGSLDVRSVNLRRERCAKDAVDFLLDVQKLQSSRIVEYVTRFLLQFLSVVKVGSR